MKKFKYTKISKNKGMQFNKLNYGLWALQSVTYGFLSSVHVKFIKQIINKNINNFKFNIILNLVVTKKPLETRMGGGKSNICDTQCFVKPGSNLVEFCNVSSSLVFYISKIISNKISIKLKLIKINE